MLHGVNIAFAFQHFDDGLFWHVCAQWAAGTADDESLKRVTVLASFIGETNILPGTISGLQEDGLIAVETDAGEFVGQLTVENWQPEAGQKAVASIRPEAIRIAHAESEPQGEIVETSYLGNVIQYRVRTAKGVEIQVSEMNPRRVMKQGTGVTLDLSPEDVVILKD